MFKLQILILFFFAHNYLFAQKVNGFAPDSVSLHPQNKVMFFADVSPLFFLSGGWGFAFGAESGRIQSGINLVGVSKLGKDLSKSLFKNHQDLDVRNNLGTELIVNYFLKTSRKGFYASGILGYSQFNVKNTITNSGKLRAVSFYGDLRIGFRWFPFKKYFYIDGAFGFSQKIISTTNSNYTFKPGLSFFPFLNIGARFNLNKPKK